jgi:hypothetical protein
LDRQDYNIQINMVNWKPSDPQIACAEIYGTVETMIPLGSDFDPHATHSVDVNGVAARLKAEDAILIRPLIIDTKQL